MIKFTEIDRMYVRIIDICHVLTETLSEFNSVQAVRKLDTVQIPIEKISEFNCV